jgi:hypothetical protein
MKAQISLNGKLLYTISGVTEIGLDTDHPGLTTLWAGKGKDRRMIASVPKGHTVVGIPENVKKVEHIVDPGTMDEIKEYVSLQERMIELAKIPIRFKYEYAGAETKPKELTLEDCVKDSVYVINAVGEIRPMSICNSGKYGCYPTSVIAEKVLLYGLLQSVAYKLNEGKEGGRSIIYLGDNELDVTDCVFRKSDEPKFYTNELARQAIKIFENSKFDLKKLFQ